MDLMKILIAAVLLACSGQSLALFMPEDFKISTETTDASDGGCGVATAPLRDAVKH